MLGDNEYWFKILYGDGAVMELDFTKALRWWSWFKNVYGDGALMKLVLFGRGGDGFSFDLHAGL